MPLTGPYLTSFNTVIVHCITSIYRWKNLGATANTELNHSKCILGRHCCQLVFYTTSSSQRSAEVLWRYVLPNTLTRNSHTASYTVGGRPHANSASYCKGNADVSSQPHMQPPAPFLCFPSHRAPWGRCSKQKHIALIPQTSHTTKTRCVNLVPCITTC